MAKHEHPHYHLSLKRGEKLLPFDIVYKQEIIDNFFCDGVKGILKISIRAQDR